MDILLALLILVVGFLLYSAAQIVRARRGNKVPARTPRTRNAVGAGSDKASEPRRALQRISAVQFMEVAAQTDDILLIDLRPFHLNAPLPVSAPHVLRLRTNQLEEVLRQLPEDRSAVFYGASDLSVFMIMTSLYLRGSAPLYILHPESSREEAA